MELIVVMAILAAMTASVMPIFHDALADAKVEDGIDDLYATLQYAESISISEAVEYRVYIQPEFNRYWLARFTHLENGEKVFEPVMDGYRGIMHLPPHLVIDRIRAAEDRRFDYDAYYIAFYPSGACDEATIRIEEEGARFQDYEIATRGRSGRMELHLPR